MNNSNEANEKTDKKPKKNLKKIRRSQTNKIIPENNSQQKIIQNNNITIKNFEKLLITEQENFNKSTKNFLVNSDVKSGNR